MHCPNCPTEPLKAVLTQASIEVDRCEKCGGIWLDKGELYLFSKRPKVLRYYFERGLQYAAPTNRRSPKSGQPMQEVPLAIDGLKIDYDPETQGLWLDRAELEMLLGANLQLFGMWMDEQIGSAPPVEIRDGALQPSTPQIDLRVEQAQQQRFTRIGTGLTPLPNLAIRSTTVLLGLFALLTLGLILFVEFLGLSPDTALVIGVIVAILQFALGPWLMDLTLRWLHGLRWVSLEQLPGWLGHSIQRMCQSQGMKVPRIGLIDDGNPNAFTYGHTPNNARIVFTQGIVDLLEREEMEAVIAHEIGHAKHWDMLLMTIAQLIPLVLYYIYRTCVRARGSRKGRGAQLIVAIGAYVLYIISEYLVLWFSRTREYHADRFGGQVTQNPNALAKALIKIAYGLAGRAPQKEKEKQAERSVHFEGIGAMGLFDPKAARALAMASYGRGAALKGAIDSSTLQGAMQWDLWNPWAKYYELHSTHPLVAHRLRYLSEQAASLRQEPFVVFNLRRPESYWDEFAQDLLIHVAPLVAALVGAALPWSMQIGPAAIWGGALLGFGAGMLLQVGFQYPQDVFPEMNVASLLKKVKVSAVRPVPCTLRGTIIGRGVPGLLWSEDFVMQDDTGIIFLDYRQPLPLWDFFFGLLRGAQYQHESVAVTGWYRRAPVPYVELSALTTQDGTRRCYTYHGKLVVSIALILAGIVIVWL